MFFIALSGYDHKNVAGSVGNSWKFVFFFFPRMFGTGNQDTLSTNGIFCKLFQLKLEKVYSLNVMNIVCY